MYNKEKIKFLVKQINQQVEKLIKGEIDIDDITDDLKNLKEQIKKEIEIMI